VSDCGVFWSEDNGSSVLYSADEDRLLVSFHSERDSEDFTHRFLAGEYGLRGKMLMREACVGATTAHYTGPKWSDEDVATFMRDRISTEQRNYLRRFDVLNADGTGVVRSVKLGEQGEALFSVRTQRALVQIGAVRLRSTRWKMVMQGERPDIVFQ